MHGEPGFPVAEEEGTGTSWCRAWALGWEGGRCTAPHLSVSAFLIYKLSSATVLVGVVAQGGQSSLETFDLCR